MMYALRRARHSRSSRSDGCLRAWREGILITLVRALLFILSGLLLLDGCSRAVHAAQQGAICAVPYDRAADDPLFRRAQDLLTSGDFATLRTGYALTGDARDVLWVTDDATCARLADAVTMGQSANLTMPVAVVQAGNFYLVRLGPDWPDYLLDARFKVLTVFVAT